MEFHTHVTRGVRQTGGRTALVAGLTLATPPVLFVALQLAPAWDKPVGTMNGHFAVVSAVSALALLLAAGVAVAARSVPDARTFFLAMGFLTMSGIFLAHGAGTGSFYHDPLPATHMTSHSAHTPAPDLPTDGGPEISPMPTEAYSAPAATRMPPPATIARLNAVGFSARLSLMISALCFALATVRLPRRAGEAVIRLWWPLACLIALLMLAYVAVALLGPEALSWIPMNEDWLSWGVASVAWMCLAVAAWRFAQAYRLAGLPLQGTMALAMALLMEAQLFMLLGTLWQLSWWLYHVTMLAGFVGAALALLHQYRVAGDLGVVVEGLFLRDAVSGLTHGEDGALAALAAAVAAKDTETGEHVERVGDLVVAVGERLGLDETRLGPLRVAGRLHDLGKIGVPNAVLRKPGPLTADEFAVMKRHSPRGWQVARRAGPLSEVAGFIRAHHERIDGTGYPDGLRGEEIPLEARIIAVADVWDALTCDRPYRRAMPHDEAAAIVWKESGTKLDPRCVAALFAVLAERAGPTPDVTGPVHIPRDSLITGAAA